MSRYSWITVLLLSFLFISTCGKDDKSSAEKAQEAQKAIQEGMKKEQQLYQSMQKAGETLEKSVQEQKGKAKN